MKKLLFFCVAVEWYCECGSVISFCFWLLTCAKQKGVRSARNKSNFCFVVAWAVLGLASKGTTDASTARVKSVSAPKNHIKSVVDTFRHFPTFFLRVTFDSVRRCASPCSAFIRRPHKNSAKGASTRNFTLTARCYADVKESKRASDVKQIFIFVLPGRYERSIPARRRLAPAATAIYIWRSRHRRRSFGSSFFFLLLRPPADAD